MLDAVRRTIGVPILTDVHEDTPLAEVAAVVDVLQTPAFLCRQTNFIINAASQGIPVNIKKGQFLSPGEMGNVVAKARSTGNDAIMVCERGFSFGYNNLVFRDMRSRSPSCALTGSSTGGVRCHPFGALPLPGGQQGPPRAASANSCRSWRARRSLLGHHAGLFMRRPIRMPRRHCPADGPNAWPLSRMESLLVTLKELDRAVEVKAV